MLILVILHILTGTEEPVIQRFGVKTEGAWVVSEMIDDGVDDADGVGETLLILDKYVFLFRPLKGAEVGCFSTSRISIISNGNDRQELGADVSHDFGGKCQSFRVLVVASRTHKKVGDIESVFQSVELTIKGKIELENLRQNITLQLKCRRLDVEDGRRRINEFVSVLEKPFVGLDSEAKNALRLWLHLK